MYEVYEDTFNNRYIWNWDSMTYDGSSYSKSGNVYDMTFKVKDNTDDKIVRIKLKGTWSAVYHYFWIDGFEISDYAVVQGQDMIDNFFVYLTVLCHLT